jgi:hypothetical protein
MTTPTNRAAHRHVPPTEPTLITWLRRDAQRHCGHNDLLALRLLDAVNRIEFVAEQTRTAVHAPASAHTATDDRPIGAAHDDHSTVRN